MLWDWGVRSSCDVILRLLNVSYLRSPLFTECMSEISPFPFAGSGSVLVIEAFSMFGKGTDIGGTWGGL